MSAAERTEDTQAVLRRRAWRQHGGLLLLWSLAWSALALAMLTSYQPLLQMTRRAIDHSFSQRAIARNLAEAAANEALWYAQYGLYDLMILAFGCNAPWTASCIDKGAPLVDFNNDGRVSVADVQAPIQTPFHGSHGWNPQVSSNSSTPTTKTGSLTAGDGSGQVIGNYSVEVSRLHFPQPWIVAKGCVPQGCNLATGAGATHTRTTRVTLERVKPQFLYAAFGGHRVILRGGSSSTNVQIDSYNSWSGTYGGTNVGQQGDIGTNAKGSSPQVDIGPSVLVQGKLMVTPGTLVTIPSGTITDYVPGGQIEQQEHTLPRVNIPTSIFSWTPPPNPKWDIFSTPQMDATSGMYKIPAGGTWYCSTRILVKSLEVEGTFRMEDGCELLVDNGYFTTWALKTTGDGQISKAGTAPARIFVRDGSFSLTGLGASFYTSLVPNPPPPTFQLFATCTTLPCSYPQTSLLAQTRTFYGVVYVEDGSLDMQRGTLGGIDYNATYQGAFVAGKNLNVGTVPSSNTVSLHYDEQVGDVELDGTDTKYQPGEKYYRILSWQTE